LLLLLVLACGHPVGLGAAAAPEAPAAQAAVSSAPSPRAARRILHDARAAEHLGDLQRAFDLARDAYVARPSRATLRYVEGLEGRLRGSDGVAASDGGAPLPHPGAGG
jgi:hypothetical protein